MKSSKVEKDMNINTPFKIRDFIIDPIKNRIIKSGHEVHIEQKMMMVLVVLAIKQGKIVSRQEIMEFAWPDVFVTEETLTRCISLLRKEFKEKANYPDIIKTVRNQGYQLVSPVESLDNKDTLRLNRNSRSSFYKQYKIQLSLILLTFAVISIISITTISNKTPSLPEFKKPFTTLLGNELYPSFSPDSKTISFAWSGEQNQWDIYIQEEGKEPEQLTDTPAKELGSAWSPDGQAIAFIRNYESDSEIILLDLDTKKEQVIARRSIAYKSNIDWSPDGKWIAFADSAGNRASTGIFMVSPDTKQKIQLTKPKAEHWGDYDPSFSQDGKMLAFTASVSFGNKALFIVDLKSGDQTRITQDQMTINGHTWVSDNRHIIYSSEHPLPESLWKIDLETKQTTWLNKTGQYPQLNSDGKSLVVENILRDYNLWITGSTSDSLYLLKINSTRMESDPVFSRSGKNLAFISNRTGSPELWVSDLISDSLTRMTDFNGEITVSFPQWSPDNRYISFNGFTNQGNADIFVIDLITKNIIQVSDEPSNEVFPVWAPDSRTLFFGSNRTGKWHIWSKSIGENEFKKVTSVNGYAGYISLEDNTLYFTRFDSKGLWKQKLYKNQDAELIIEDFDYLLPYNWHILNQNIYYLRQMPFPEEDFEIIEYSLSSSNIKQFKKIKYQPGIEYFIMHPELKKIIFLKNDLLRVDIGLYKDKL